MLLIIGAGIVGVSYEHAICIKYLECFLLKKAKKGILFLQTTTFHRIRIVGKNVHFLDSPEQLSPPKKQRCIAPMTVLLVYVLPEGVP